MEIVKVKVTGFLGLVAQKNKKQIVPHVSRKNTGASAFVSLALQAPPQTWPMLRNRDKTGALR